MGTILADTIERHEPDILNDWLGLQAQSGASKQAGHQKASCEKPRNSFCARFMMPYEMMAI
jgi:hypothetical protein